jgi:hypothetical protein
MEDPAALGLLYGAVLDQWTTRPDPFNGPNWLGTHTPYTWWWKKSSFRNVVYFKYIPYNEQCPAFVFAAILTDLNCTGFRQHSFLYRHATCFGLCFITYCTLTLSWTAPSCSVLCTYTKCVLTEISTAWRSQTFREPLRSHSTRCSLSYWRRH